MSQNVQYYDFQRRSATACEPEPSQRSAADSNHRGLAEARLDPALRSLHRLADHVYLPFCSDAEAAPEMPDMQSTPSVCTLSAEQRCARKATGDMAEGRADARIDLRCGMQLGLLNQHDSALTASMVVDYLSNTSILLWEIGDIATLPSWQRLARITASLRASSLCLGAVGLAALFGRLEQAVARQDLIEFIDVFGRVLDAFPAVSESLLTLASD